ncbi:MAG TPA: 4-hydroxybenzoate octaprenyltransferase [Rhodocyclaceae bacterium]|nr:4-hydroxybenzoate octaprenyltransferase [Rhodocyclaceae bacterium]
MSLRALAGRLGSYERLMRLDKPIGTLLLLWPTLWALLIAADGRPNLFVVWIFSLGTLLMRSAGVVVNDYADRKYDPEVKRTRARPLATGEVSVREAMWLAAVLALAAFLLILPLNHLVWKLSVVAVFLAVSYPYTKRFLAIPQAYLGIAFGFGIPMGFAAVLGTVPLLGWLLLLANIFWAIAYDTEYAMVDRDDDIRIGIRTSAITFGRFDVAAVMLCYAAMLAILAWIGVELRYGIWYYAGLIVAAGMMAYHYLLIRSRGREGCFKAFLHNNWVGAAICAGLLADFHLRPLLGG